MKQKRSKVWLLCVVMMLGITTAWAQGPPNAPTNLVATPMNGGGSIAFTAPSNNGGSAITNYQYSINDGASWIPFLPADNMPPVVITGLTNGTTYAVKLRAVNGFGVTSTPVSATVNLTPAPPCTPTTSTTTLTNCGAYTWNGQTYSNSGTYTYTTTNAAGCDSTATLNLTISKPAGTEWTLQTYANPNEAEFGGIAYGNGKFVVLKNDAATGGVMTSTDGINWTDRSTADNSLSFGDIVYGNGLFVAIARDAVMTSTDGITWTMQSAPNPPGYWYSITYGNGMFVAVGNVGNAMYSMDGINWSLGNTPDNSSDFYGVAYGNGLFVAVGSRGTNRVMTSSDGINWTYKTAAENNFWTSVTYGNGLFVAVAAGGTNRVMTSADGTNWTASSVPAIFWNDIIFADQKFLAVGDGATTRVMSSTDGINWTSVDAPQKGWSGIAYGNGRFLATSYDATDDNIMTSIAGPGCPVACEPTSSRTYITNCGAYTWNGQSYNASGTYTWTGTNAAGCDSIATLNLTISKPAGAEWTLQTVTNPDPNNNYIEFGGIAYGNGKFVVLKNDAVNGGVMTSTDGINWTDRLTPNNSESFYDIVYGNGLFVAIARNGTQAVMTSTDGIAWTLQSTPNPSPASSWYTITYGNGMFVAVGQWGRSMYSLDGINWTLGSVPDAITSWQGVTYGNGLFVAVASTETNRVMTSSDGINWTYKTAAENNFWQNVTYGNGRFVAIASNGTNRVMTSTDGTTWTSASAVSAIRWNDIIFADQKFVAVGDGATTRVMSSTDGINWTSLDAPQMGWSSIAYGNGRFVASAYDATDDNIMTSIAGPGCPVACEPTSSRTYITNCGAYTWNGQSYNASGTYTWTGTNKAGCDSTATLNLTISKPAGAEWTLQTVANPDYIYYSNIAYGNGLFVIVKEDGGTNGAMTSTDGISWTQQTTPDADWQDITYGNGLFVAVTNVGTKRVMTSPDGINWTLQTTPDNGSFNNWYSVTYGNGLFVALADYGKNMSSTDGINWTIGVTDISKNRWMSVTYANGLFVAVSDFADPGIDKVITSADGINWTYRSAPISEYWSGISYGNGLFVAVGSGSNGVMTSPDGINWTARNAAQVPNQSCEDVTFGNGLFVAVSRFGDNKVMTSSDGINWTSVNSPSPTGGGLEAVAYGNNRFVAIGANAEADDIMTSIAGVGCAPACTPTTSTTTITNCGAYTWNGQTYDASGTYTWTGTNAAGCDSTATLNLTVTYDAASLTIGANFQGGKIGYILQDGDPGYDATKVKGLVVAANDYAPKPWAIGSYLTTATGVTDTAIGTGAANTAALVNLMGPGDYLAYRYDTLTLGGFTDWYLPSKYEMKKILANFSSLNIYLNSQGPVLRISSFYSSSSELSDSQFGSVYLNYNNNTTSLILFDNTVSKSNPSGPSRPVRSFEVTSCAPACAPASVTTIAADSVSSKGALAKGSVSGDCSVAPVRGFVYSSVDNTPQIGESSVTNEPVGTGNGSFSKKLTGLATGTTYYFRAYATEGSTVYGTVQSFTPACDSRYEDSLAIDGDVVVSSIGIDSQYLSTPVGCRTVALINPTGGLPVSGSITGKIRVFSTVPYHAGRPYVGRSYEITPGFNASTATATITLYFTQADFDLYNTSPNGVDLPFNGADVENNKVNLRIYKFSGTSSNGSGHPSTYTQPGVMIDPDDHKIFWNEGLKRWEVTFITTGFSGFFAGNETTTLLPIVLTGLNGKPTASGNLISWRTGEEAEAMAFEVERSMDGRHFEPLGRVSVKGSGSAYEYNDHVAAGMMHYYRLKLLNKDGTYRYSEIISIRNRNGSWAELVLTPNPASKAIQLNTLAEKGGVKIYNLQGGVVLSQNWRKGEAIPVGQLPAGYYIVELTTQEGVSREKLWRN